jgi:hypothetical protein
MMILSPCRVGGLLQHAPFFNTGGKDGNSLDCPQRDVNWKNRTGKARVTVDDARNGPSQAPLALSQLADPSSAPDPPAEVIARVVAALRAEPPLPHTVGSTARSVQEAAAHGARGSGSRLRVGTAAIGVAAMLAAAGVGTAMLLRTPDRASTTSPTAERITVSNPGGGLPLADSEILALLEQPVDLGPLTEPQRRASCLSGLGYPMHALVLGARPLAVGGRSGVLMLLPGDTERLVNAVVVGLNCSSADTGLLAERVVSRP